MLLLASPPPDFIHTRIVELFETAENLPSELEAYECKRCSKHGLYAVTLAVFPDDCRCEVRSPVAAVPQVIIEDEDPQHCARILEAELRRKKTAQVALFQHRRLPPKRAAHAVHAYHWLARKLGAIA